MPARTTLRDIPPEIVQGERDALMPEVRASYLQLILRQCRNAPDGLGEQILARVSPGDVSAIAGAGVTDWLPFALHQRLQDAKNEVVGPERAAEVTRTLVLVTLGTPVLGGFLSHVLQLLGPDPGPALKWLPRAYSMIFRGAGRLETWVHPGARLAAVNLVDMPQEVAESRSFVTSVGHAVSTVYPITGFDGTCRLSSWEPDRGRARFELTWDVPGRLR